MSTLNCTQLMRKRSPDSGTSVGQLAWMRCSEVETRWMLAGEPSPLKTSISTTISVSAVPSSP